MKVNRRLLTLLLVASALLLTFSPSGDTANALEHWRVPLSEPKLVREFIQPSSDWSAGHRGVDYEVSEGDPVYATFDGEITFAGRVVNRSTITIRHQNALYSSVEPVCPSVPVGKVVKSGEVLGVVCRSANYLSHCEPDICLHFSLRTSSGYLSPLLKLGGLSPSRLKPWDGLFCNPPSSAQC